ncbi:hypothetical protein [Thermococcus gorgonarius]|uniref:hypothetical protein n=1 Tax=Thermococcus gorgonarius TaxID=71997 RepID=UPI001E5AB4AE|nr:hypothetical protein [Thermococcus gorgonarius]
MRKALLLLFLFALPLASAAPPWFKPGAYLSYHALDPAGRNLAVYHCNGTYFLISGVSEVTVNFSVLEVYENRARVRVELVLVPALKNESSVRPGLRITFLSGSEGSCGFWGDGEELNGTVYGNEGGKLINVTTIIVYHPLTFSGTYLVNLEDGTVYGSDGRPLGHTALWGLYELKPGDVFTYVNGTPVRVVRNNNVDYDLITYWKTFQRPNGNLVTNWTHVVLPFYETHFMGVYYYKPALDITGVIMDAPPGY